MRGDTKPLIAGPKENRQPKLHRRSSGPSSGVGWRIAGGGGVLEHWRGTGAAVFPKSFHSASAAVSRFEHNVQTVKGN